MYNYFNHKIIKMQLWKGKEKKKPNNQGLNFCFQDSFDTETKSITFWEMFPSCQHYPDTEGTLTALDIIPVFKGLY